MENWRYNFQAITHFSVVNVEPYSPRQKDIETLTLEIGSKIPGGRYPLTLIEPFPPLGRPGEYLNRLRSLCAENIDSIWVFDKPDDGHWARIEIRGKAPGATVFVNCARVEGVPGQAGAESGAVHAVDGENHDGQ